MVYGVRFRIGARPDQPLEFRGNSVAGELEGFGATYSGGSWTVPSYVTFAGNLIAPPQARPTVDQVILHPNRYEPARAHLMAIDFSKNGRVMVDASGWLSAGQRVQIFEPWGMWDAPVFSGAWPAGGLDLPVDGARVLVAVKEAAPGGAPPPAGGSIRIKDRIEEAPLRWSRRLGRR
jgi:hypothetical protein